MARTAGSTWLVLGALLGGALLQPVACDRGQGPDPEVARVLAEVLAAVGPEVVVPTLARVGVAADGLVAATGAWAAAERAGADAEPARIAAQEAWRATMDVWQEAEVHLVGPAASTSAPAGEGLRDRVYSWPTTNPCRVDQETVSGEWDSGTFFVDELVNVYGLDALETLLFSPPGVNVCPPQVDINASGSWEGLGADGVQQNRADYASALALEVSAAVVELTERWDPGGGDFGSVLAEAGDAGSPYDSQEAGLNAVFDALYYLELETQDAKLGDPLGLRDCVGDACADLVETPVAGGSNLWIAANLRGFRALFVGGDGSGLDTLLATVGHPDVADVLLAALDEADRAAVVLDVPIDVAARTDPAAALALHEAISAVTSLLETDVATLLALQIPAEADGDND